MDTEIKRFMLEERRWCEIPDESGLKCERASVYILMLPNQYPVAVCQECADYIFKEVGRNVCNPR